MKIKRYYGLVRTDYGLYIHVDLYWHTSKGGFATWLGPCSRQKTNGAGSTTRVWFY